MITRDEFLSLAGAEDVRSVFVPAFDRDVYFRLIDADEMDRHQIRMQRRQGDDINMRASLLATCICDENGKRLFKDADAERLRKMKLVHIEPLIDAIMEANGMTPAAIADAEKNSQTTRSFNGGIGLEESCACPSGSANEA